MRRFRRLCLAATAIAFVVSACGGEPVGDGAEDPQETGAEAGGAEEETERDQRELRKQKRAYERCESSYAGALDALEEVDVQLDQGMGFNEYDVLLSDAEAEFDEAASGPDPTSQCANLVSRPAEEALKSYIAARRIWKDCFEEECPGLQRHWGDASGHLAKALNGLATLAPPP